MQDTNTGAPAVLGDYLTDKELADQLDKSPRTLERWRRLREGPAPTRIGRKLYYHREAVARWLRSQEVELV